MTYDTDYEECMGCTAERCRGAGFLDVKLANGKTALLCPNCTETAVVDAVKRDHALTNLRLLDLRKLLEKVPPVDPVE